MWSVSPSCRRGLPTASRRDVDGSTAQSRESIPVADRESRKTMPVLFIGKGPASAFLGQALREDKHGSRCENDDDCGHLSRPLKRRQTRKGSTSGLIGSRDLCRERDEDIPQKRTGRFVRGGEYEHPAFRLSVNPEPCRSCIERVDNIPSLSDDELVSYHQRHL